MVVVQFVAWIAAFYVVGFAALAFPERWRIATPAFLLSLWGLVEAWPLVRYGAADGGVIAIFALVLLVSGTLGGVMVGAARREIADLDRKTAALTAR